MRVEDIEKVRVNPYSGMLKIPGTMFVLSGNVPVFPVGNIIKPDVMGDDRKSRKNRVPILDVNSGCHIEERRGVRRVGVTEQAFEFGK